MTDSITRQLAALPMIPTPALKAKWRKLFGKEPPPFNRPYLISRLAYRIQELAHGGLKPAARARLDTLADRLDGKRGQKNLSSHRPVAGTRLIRDWHGVEHVVTVTRSGFDYQGRPYQSLSAIARAITGTPWNGPLFFGLRGAKR